MPSYRRLKKAEIQQLCDSRGIDSAGCKTKADLINAIEQHDLRNDALIEEDDDVHENDNDNASETNYYETEANSVGQTEGQDDLESSETDEERNGDDDRVDVHRVQRQGRVESESVATLRLQLSLTQEQRRLREEEILAKEREWEIEKERLLLHSERERSAQRMAGTSDFKDIKAILPSMCDVDVISFFSSFEKILNLHEVDKSLWARLLPSQLSPKALKSYARLSLDETKCYETVKRIILQSFHLDANAYLKGFRSLKRSGNSSYKMFLTNLTELMQRFFDAKNITTFEALAQEFLQEQFLCSLNDNVRQFVISKRPANATECAEFADPYWEISKIGREAERKKTQTKEI